MHSILYGNSTKKVRIIIWSMICKNKLLDYKMQGKGNNNNSSDDEEF